jgi:hypothetical protein
MGWPSGFGQRLLVENNFADHFHTAGDSDSGKGDGGGDQILFGVGHSDARVGLLVAMA